ncbi:MAG: KpsF/GutQ family sugar-phosphate isomerase [Armatimonadota bacterium]|nr:KpsF/GutQ family sugar-phosphate isomerase [Armatimonadota bacterium]
MRETLLQEAEAIQRLSRRLGTDFEDTAQRILECTGRVVTCGIGKAGDIAKKFSSTLSSTGTPSFFLHPADAVHGDLGMLRKEDVVILLSNSGETEEVLRLFAPLRQIGVSTILITGRGQSTAAKQADIALDIAVETEACPHNLAPTTSTTVMLALADALAIAVMRARQFTKDEYALVHPSGSLGRRLLMRVRDAMRQGDDLPLVGPETPFLDVLAAITKAGAGAACVVDPDGSLLGLVADGDIRRRLLSEKEGALTDRAEELMTVNPASTEADALAIECLEAFENHPKKIGEMPVLEEGRVVGMVMLKDLIRLGI